VESRLDTLWARAALALAAALAMLFVTCATAQGATVTVRAGDTLSSIAARNGTSVAALARANGIRNPNLVRLGMRLTIPGAGGGAGGGGGGTYRVRSGDTLGGIAARHGTTVAALARANGIRNPSLIRIGMRLTVPAGGSGSAPAPAAAAGGTHRVRPGETLGGIAARYGTSVSTLAALNAISDPSRIVAGRLLRLPAGTSPVRLVPTPGVADLIARHAARYGVDPALARAIAWQESGWSQDARSSVGAIGVMQLMPGTAHWLGPALIGRHIDPHVLSDNIEGGVAYLGWLIRHSGSTHRAIMAYYQGLTSLRHRGPFDDTKDYLASVTAFYGRV
jgi:N-acetylmuramoyl-L-alanine amidase